MSMLHADSLSETFNAVNDSFLLGLEPSAEDRTRTALWIAGRLGLPGAYADSFALTAGEREHGIRLYTGERTGSAAARHIAGQEACRALRLLGVGTPAVAQALATATGNLQSRIGPLRPPTGSGHRFDKYLGGAFCCGRCSVGFWRHVAVGGFDDRERRLATGLAFLETRAKSDHTWTVFPFWYTVSALIEMPPDLAIPHLRHAAPRLERLARRGSPGDPFVGRRQAVAQRALALC